ncbi:fungal-specific transcription factor domain-containing protein [Whalleya microplaca]|nr:fungal-specific transcription factor domain-containing protein [Whalleya microplaca]
MLGDEPSIEGSSGGHAAESLSCVSCRTRKLKCDRSKPRCNRCERVNGECTYPESRRKPAFKRKNVRELEARLAQVEVLLKEAGEKRARNGKAVKNVTVDTTEVSSVPTTEVPITEDVCLQGMDFTGPGPNPSFEQFDDNATFSFQDDPTATFPTGDSNDQRQDNDTFNGELMDLGGIFESLPPFEIMEDLNRIFFERQHHFIPIVHPARYLQSFYSAPHMKPPMCLQYAIWALASNGHPKYASYQDVFYRRARQYVDADEMKGYGEHFITLNHAQTWCIIATNEAKSMMFTRAAMSCARAVRLVEMMGLHRLDGDAEEMSPTLLPPRDWTELEERRRVFWGIFCIDSHCSISTGWPHLIDASEITTHLPASEYAFHSGDAQETSTIHDAFKAQPYSSFAGAILVCHLFNQILKHVHRPKPNDNPENYEYGEYWQRHRDIDNTLSSAFMFLPESFRLPENYRDLTAVHTNLNLHASVICLHHAAIERIDTYKLPESVKKISQNRLSTSAQEIVNIIKLTSHVNSSPRSPLAALSLYCAASVYVYLCKETQAQAGTNIGNLDFIITAMEAVGRDHAITRAFLRQVVLDIERNEIQHIVRLPGLGNLSEDFTSNITHNIPLLARSKISRHSEVQPPLPGRLPLGKPMGKILNPDEYDCAVGTWTSTIRDDKPFASGSDSATDASRSKRKRTTQTPLTSTPSTHASPTEGLSTPQAFPGGSGVLATPGPQTPYMNLPHRTGSPAPNGNANTQPATTSKQSAPQNNGRLGVSFSHSMLGSLGPTPFATAGRGPGDTQTAAGGQGNWDLASLCMYSRFANEGDNANMAGGNGSWSGMGDEGVGVGVDWDALGASLGIDPVSMAGTFGLRGGEGGKDGGMENDAG